MPVFLFDEAHKALLFFYGSVSTFRKYAFPDCIGFAARQESVKLGNLVIWTLPIFLFDEAHKALLFLRQRTSSVKLYIDFTLCIILFLQNFDKLLINF